MKCGRSSGDRSLWAQWAVYDLIFLNPIFKRTPRIDKNKAYRIKAYQGQDTEYATE